MQSKNDTHQRLPTERYQHASTHYRNDAIQRIGKRLVERDRKRNIAEAGHPFRVSPAYLTTPLD